MDSQPAYARERVPAVMARTILFTLPAHLSPCIMTKREQTVLVLQGSDALGAYQAGVYEGIAESDRAPDWIAEVSIGAASREHLDRKLETNL